MLSRALFLLTLSAASDSEIFNDGGIESHLHKTRGNTVTESSSPRGCLYDGRWYAAGAPVVTRAACLRCSCGLGALACSHRACAQLPPPPRHCHVLHRKGACCPELHCPDGVMVTEHGASARFEADDYPDATSSAALSHACVEGGTVFAAGSAMESHVACEQCFCLGGTRRCVRPRCLPSPPGCQPRPAPGACCPQRYYCEHLATTPGHRPHDCKVDGNWIMEGERVEKSYSRNNCTHCFCLRGSVHCQPLACAPPLLGCKPLIRPGQCCTHQYQCHHEEKHEMVDVIKEVAKSNLLVTHNALTTFNNEDRSFHTSKTDKQETTTKVNVSKLSSTKQDNTSFTSHENDVAATKVKRKTNDVITSTKHQTESTTPFKVVEDPISSKRKSSNASVDEHFSSIALKSNENFTDQASESIKIMINGTINCTNTFSSTLIPINSTHDGVGSIPVQDIKETLNIDRMDTEDQTYSPHDIITNRTPDGSFDENESFTINVTSSLHANTNNSLPTFPKAGVVTDIKHVVNISKKTKEDYDYDYTEPTFPPSLPNLKIIPFVAADAVVEDDDIVQKESVSYPVLEREDKFPVYYPKTNKETPFATRREDVYQQTKYPLFTSEKIDSEFSSNNHKSDSDQTDYPGIHSDLDATIHEYTLSATLGSAIPGGNKLVNKPHSNTIDTKNPPVNLFSPPMETEGGFIPKGPGLIDEYYAVYPSTPSGPHIPHLTTSMQLDTSKGECVLEDGRRVSEGDSIPVACAVCTCEWGELHCLPRTCITPPGCNRKSISKSSSDSCCGELVCKKGETTTSTEINLTTKISTTTELSTTTETKDMLVEVEVSNNKIENKTNLELLPSDIIDKDIPTNNTSTATTTKYNLVNLTSEPNKEQNIINNTKQYDSTSNYTSANKTNVILNTVTTRVTDEDVTTNHEPQYDDQNSHSAEYEDEEDDDGFSFGNVLKLLLSESYGSTSPIPIKKKPSIFLSTQPPSTTITAHTTTKTAQPATTKLFTKKPLPNIAIQSSVAPFIPLPPHRPLYGPHKTVFPPTSVNRIDHLVLGEATAIKRTTSRPVSTIKPIISSLSTGRPIVTTKKPIPTSRLPEITTKTEAIASGVYTSVSHEGPRLPSTNSFGIGPGLLKLAGCNIYGRMYRVGRIIAELSNPCQECRCTELGVQCRDLSC